MGRERSVFPTQVAFGLLLLTVGILLFLQNVGWLDGVVWRFWPLVLVAVGLLKLLTAASGGDRLLGTGLILFGGMRLAVHSLGYNIGPLDILAGILILFGAAAVWRGVAGRPSGAAVVRSYDNELVNALAFMGGFGRKCTSQAFAGGNVTAFMGGIQLDLRGCDLREPAVLDIFVMWGGIEIRIPADWTLDLRGTPILGGFEDKTDAPATPDHKRLIVRGAAIMGGVEIKN